MTPADRPLIRQKMQQSGQWDTFLALRDRYKSQGVPLDEAWSRAYADLTAPDEMPAQRPDVIDILDSGTDGGVSPPCPLSVPSSPPGVGGLLGETRDMSAVVKWIFDNIDDADVRRSQAPSPGAWSWMRTLRESEEAKIDFYRRHVTKMLKPESEDEDVVQFDDDGRRCRETIEEIKRMAAEAERLTI